MFRRPRGCFYGSERLRLPPAPTLDAIAAAAKTAQITHCRTEGCIADITINQAMTILLVVQATALGVTNPPPKKP